MAIMNISGWKEVGSHNSNGVPVLKGLNSKQNVTFTTTNSNTTALGAGDKFVRIYVDAEAYIELGDSTVTAAIGDIVMAAGESIVIERDSWTHVAAVTK